MALVALERLVPSGQREFGLGMVEGRAGPGAGVVTDGTIGREVRGSVIRIGGAFVSVQVAVHAGRGCSGELPINVAGLAVERGMYTGEREMSDRGVIEFRAAP